jgi:hypothetical protein
MKLYEQWKELTGREMGKKENDAFWNTYLEKEKVNYESILTNRNCVIEGNVGELALKSDMDAVTFAGFLDGINTSLVNPLELDDIEESSVIKIEIDFEKLYYNMLEAKAEWLYNLPQWEDILTEEKRNEITKEFRISKIAVSNKVGRNDPCPCGSGKKYKKCCGK